MLACTYHADEFAGIDIFTDEVLHRGVLRYRLSAFGTPGNHEKIKLVLMMCKVWIQVQLGYVVNYPPEWTLEEKSKCQEGC